MYNAEINAAIQAKLVIDGSTATAPKGVHLTDLFVGDACTILDIDRPAKDRGYADELLRKYGQKLSAAGFTVNWTYSAYAIYAHLSDEETQYMLALAAA